MMEKRGLMVEERKIDKSKWYSYEGKVVVWSKIIHLAGMVTAASTWKLVFTWVPFSVTISRLLRYSIKCPWKDCSRKSPWSIYHESELSHSTKYFSNFKPFALSYTELQIFGKVSKYYKGEILQCRRVNTMRILQEEGLYNRFGICLLSYFSLLNAIRENRRLLVCQLQSRCPPWNSDISLAPCKVLERRRRNLNWPTTVAERLAGSKWIWPTPRHVLNSAGVIFTCSFHVFVYIYIKTPRVKIMAKINFWFTCIHNIGNWSRKTELSRNAWRKAQLEILY